VIEVSRVEELLRKILAVELWNVRHLDEKRRHDDPGASIAVEIDGEKFKVVLWASEISRSPSFSQVQEKLLSLVHELSSGEVLENGR